MIPQSHSPPYKADQGNEDPGETKQIEEQKEKQKERQKEKQKQRERRPKDAPHVPAKRTTRGSLAETPGAA